MGASSIDCKENTEDVISERSGTIASENYKVRKRGGSNSGRRHCNLTEKNKNSKKKMSRCV